MASWKRLLFFAHRWLGIVLCAFFALWFFSGIFMMYVDFPQLTRLERLAAAASLDFSTARLAPGAAVAALSAGDFDMAGTPNVNRPLAVENPNAPADVASVRLGMLLGRPVYYVYPDSEGQPRAVLADSGEVLDRLGREVALRSAAEFARHRGLDGAGLRYLGLVQTDQWSVSSGLNAHRPLHHVAIGDNAGTQLYVSSTTGEVVRDSRRIERALNYPAAVTHWLYPTFVRRHVDFWGWMVNVLSGAGVVLAVSGLWIGVLRWRRPTRPGMSSIPYRGKMRWHHITGLAFGIVALTWVLSGLLSMNPGDINPSRSPTSEQIQVLSGKALTPDDFELPVRLPAGADIAEAELMHYDGSPYYLATARNGSVQMLPAGEPRGSLPSVDRVIARVPLLMPDARLERARLLEDYDDYWYTRRPEHGGRVLPVIRAEFFDAAGTWFHIDPATGTVLERTTHFNRLYRWLYNGLHSWDIRWLWERRPLWDIAVITFSLGGLALSLIGVVVGYRHMRIEVRMARAKRRRRMAAMSEVSV